MVSAAGSLGALLSAPIGQMLNEGYGWRIGLAGFVVLSLLMIPAAWYAGRVDKIPLPKPAADDIGDASAGAAVEDRVRQCLVRGDDLRLFRLRHAARVPHHASAVLSCDLRPGPDAERADARHDRRLQRARQPVLRLGRPALEQAGAARRRSTSSARSRSPGTSCCRRRRRRRCCSARSWASSGWASGRWSRARSPRCSGCDGRR